MFELIELHHAKPPIEPDADRHRTVTPRQYARLNAPRPSLLGLLALPLALVRRLARGRAADTPSTTPARARTRTITAKLAP